MAMKLLDIILRTVKSISLSGWSFLPVLNLVAHVNRELYGFAQFEQELMFLYFLLSLVIYFKRDREKGREVGGE